jgi:3-oxoacyl-[acyl-carrier protein] reductase
MPQISLSTSLTDAVALITGGGRGIGLAIARKLAALGASAVITGRDQPRLDEAAREIATEGGRAEGVECDVTSLDSVRALGTRLQERYGRIDILVNNAGIGGLARPLHELPPEEWDAIFHTNLRGVYYMIRTFAPMMIAQGSGQIINISSLAGKNPLPRGAAYSASKWGLNGLSYSVAEELRSHNIRVSVICPGSVNTSFGVHTGKDAQKMLQPEDVAHAVAMLVTQRPESFISEVLLRPTQKP